MALEKKLKEFAKEKRYSFKELCTDRYELKKEYEIMAVKAVIDKEESETKVSTSPKFAPLILATVLLAATFIPLVIFVYITYAFLSNVRIKQVRNDLKKFDR